MYFIHYYQYTEYISLELHLNVLGKWEEVHIETRANIDGNKA